MRKKSIDYLVAFLIILSLNFFLPRLMPGDPLLAIYGEEALLAIPPEMEEELIQKFGLDKPLPEQFLHYILSLLQGDLGYSYYYGIAVQKAILGALPWTLLLVALGLIISTVLGFLLGLESGFRYGRWQDKTFLTGMMILSGFPDFFLGILLLLFFAVILGLFPLAGALTPYTGLSGFALIKDILWHLSLPLTALVLSEITASYLLTRTTVVTVLGEPYILTARAKGLKSRSIKYKHIGRNSLLPVVTRTGTRLGRMFTGTLFIEVVFAYPGLGGLVYNALLARDYPLLQGVFFLAAAGVLTLNFLVDLIYKKIDPRMV